MNKSEIIQLTREFELKKGGITCEFFIHESEIEEFLEFVKTLKQHYGMWRVYACDSCVSYHGEGYQHAEIVYKRDIVIAGDYFFTYITQIFQVIEILPEDYIKVFNFETNSIEKHRPSYALIRKVSKEFAEWYISIEAWKHKSVLDSQMTVNKQVEWVKESENLYSRRCTNGCKALYQCRMVSVSRTSFTNGRRTNPKSKRKKYLFIGIEYNGTFIPNSRQLSYFESYLKLICPINFERL